MPRINKTTPFLTLHNAVRWSGAANRFSASLLKRTITGFSNDSRTVEKDDVFVALSTEKDDGHRYVTGALRRGAAAALVAKRKLSLVSDADANKLLVVSDPLKALQRIALKYRRALGIPIIGITGSSGKTTTRGFIAAVLKQKLTVGETSGNLNNHIGVPLSLLRFTGKEDVGVIEMGANHAREIHALSLIVGPTIGVITNIGYAHIGYFGSLAAIARAKMEITDGMSDRGGFLMLNGDDPRLIHAGSGMRRTIVYFGMSRLCHVRARNIRIVDGASTLFEVNGEEYRLAMPGRHFIYGALPAIYLGRYFGVPRELIARAIESMAPLAMRGTLEKKSGATFIVDCYNANPSSMKSAIDLLRDVSGNKRPVAIVGDMLELGRHSRRLHLALGKQLVRSGVREILAVGQQAPIVEQGALEEGMRQKNITIAANGAEALEIAKRLVRKNDVVLLKGSRGVRLETVFEGF
jgi:UDP-N-acetylmuramoyl-tripeptide--D-alanyl-D-alanine ligase